MTEIPFAELKDRWQKIWPQALALWSPYVRLRDPDLVSETTGSFALIRLNDHQVMVSLKQVNAAGLQDYGLEILAHEIGHHIYAPGDLRDMAKLLLRLKRSLPTRESSAPLVANLYTDLLINDRLWRQHRLRMPDIYQILRKKDPALAPQENSASSPKGPDLLWVFYLRTYEILWGLEKGTLTEKELVTSVLEGDAFLANRIIRRYADDWLAGAGRFGLLCLDYLLKGGGEAFELQGFHDLSQAGQGSVYPSGILEKDPEEGAPPIHPSLDSELTGEDFPQEEEPQAGASKTKTESSAPGKSFREPFELGEILRQLGADIPEDKMAHLYYKERAHPYLVPFPRRNRPQSVDPLPEGFDVWDIGSPLERIDWVETAARSPLIIPGVTTFEQVYGESPGQEPRWEPVDLDLYVDSSGSMPNPRHSISYPALAGAIICLSALRVGARIQATLWSGKDEVLVTEGFVKNEEEIFGVLTGYFGMGTAFPLPVLRETYLNRQPTDRKVHILVISDSGVTTLFDSDEKGNSGWDISALALEKSGGGGTFVLEMPSSAVKAPEYQRALEQGWDIHTVSSLEGLVEFAKKFAARHYKRNES